MLFKIITFVSKTKIPLSFIEAFRIFVENRGTIGDIE